MERTRDRKVEREREKKYISREKERREKYRQWKRGEERRGGG